MSELVSICIPNYNNATYVGEAILSAVNQTYPNIEVIVADNCSTDQSWEVISNIASKHPNVKAFRNETNVGMVNNFRATLGKASGHYISFLCSDDKLYPEAVSYTMKQFAKHNDVSFVFGNVNYSGTRTGNTDQHFQEYMVDGLWTKNSLEQNSNIAFLTGTVFKRLPESADETIKDLTFFDWYLWLRLGKGNVGFVNEVLGEHCYHENNQTKHLTPGAHKNLQGLLKVYDDLIANKVLDENMLIERKNALIEKFARNEISEVSWNNIFSNKNQVLQFYNQYHSADFIKALQLKLWTFYGKLQILGKYGFKK